MRIHNVIYNILKDNKKIQLAVKVLSKMASLYAKNNCQKKMFCNAPKSNKYLVMVLNLVSQANLTLLSMRRNYLVVPVC